MLTGSGSDYNYQPQANYFGQDSFTFKANDGQEDSNTATVSISVLAINDKPIALEQALQTNEDTAIEIILSGTDVDEDTLKYTVTQEPQNGTLTGTGQNLVFLPNENFNGDDSFKFVVNDGFISSEAAIVSIKVLPN